MDSQTTLNILILDDDEVDRIAIRRALKRSGTACLIEQVATVAQAFEKLETDRFDCLFTDYNLPRMTGLEFLLELRKREIGTPVIVLTGQGNEKIAVDLMKAGASDYIPKSEISANSLSRSLNNALRVYQAQLDAVRAKEELEEYALKLESRNKELDAFASMVAHDLKSPLTPIVGMAELLKMKHQAQLDDASVELLDTIARNGRKMSEIIESMLQLASFRHQTVTPEPIDITPIVDDVLKRLAHTAKAENATIVKPQNWPKVLGHAPWIEEVFANYISNAYKYGGTPSHIELGSTLIDQGSMIKIWVKDNGRGVEEINKAHLFTAFQRFDKDLADGHGLGLSIVERIIFKLGGEVGVESELNEGSTFWFTLPSVL